MASEEVEEKEEKKKPKSKKKLLIIIIVAVLLLGGGGGGFYYFKFMRSSEEKVEKPKPEQTSIGELETFMVNLADPGGKRYLKATVKLKVSSNEAAEECKARNFELRDMVLTLLASKEVEEIIHAEDKASLKKEIMEKLNGRLEKGQVRDVYFTEFLIQ
jgi:flagellar FliL protein